MARKIQYGETMNREKAFNTHLILFFALFLVFLGLGVFILLDGDIMLSVVGFLFAIVAIFAIIISPVVYIFDDDKLTIVYFFGIKETITWKYVRSITKRGGWFQKRRGFPVYEISYPQKEKVPFFVEGCVTSSGKTKKLLKKYCKKNIKEYWN